MGNKKVMILVGLLLVGAAGSLLYKKLSKGSSSSMNGKELLESADIPKIDKVLIEKAESRVELVKNDDGSWELASNDHFPADAKKLVGFFDAVVKTKIQRTLKHAAGEREELGLTTATHLQLFAGQDELLNLELGEAREGGGQFVSKSGGQEDIAFLLSEKIQADSDHDQWENKQLVDVKKEEVKSVEYYKPGSSQPVAKLKREKKEDKLALEGLKEKEKAKEYELNSAAGILEGVRFEDRVSADNEEAKAALNKPIKTVIELFDGTKYEVLTGNIGPKDKEKSFIKISATKPGEKSGEMKTLEMLMEKWAFQLGTYQAKKFAKTRKDFLEDEKKS